jgi:hypothetical protein
MNQNVSRGELALKYVRGLGNHGGLEHIIFFESTTITLQHKVSSIEKNIEKQHEELFWQTFVCEDNLVLRYFWVPSFPL